MNKFFKRIIVFFLDKIGYQISRIDSVSKATSSNIISSAIPYPDKIPETAIVQYSELSKDVVVGERCVLHKVVLHGDIKIGSNTTINGPGTEFYGLNYPIKIGKFCSIARHTAMQDHNHNLDCITTYFIKHNVFKEKNRDNDIVSKGGINIGNDVWVGTQSVILSGVSIGHGAVVAANSVVTKDVPPYAIVGGTPAKILKYRFQDDVIAELLNIQWWDWDLDKIKQNKELFYENLSIEKLQKIV